MTLIMTDKQELVYAAVDRLNAMTRAAYDGMEILPGLTFEGLFTASFGENWEAIELLGERGVWCAATDQCDTPDDGETVDSIVRYVWEDELKDLTELLVAFGQQCDPAATVAHTQMVKGLQALLLECPVGVVADVRSLIANYLGLIGGNTTGVELQLGDKAKAENAGP